MSALGFAAIAALSSAVGQGIGSVVNPNKDFKTNKKLMDYQNEINNANWEKQNARQDYLLANNSSIQKKSYENAGLNPALLSEGNFTGNVASSMPRLADVGLSNNFANSAQGKTANIQSAVAIANAIAQTKVANAQARNLNADADLKETDAGTRSDINQATLQNLLTENVLDQSQIDKINSETDVNKQEYSYLVETFDERVRSVTLQNDVTSEQFKKLQEETNFIKNQNLWMPRLWQSEINLQTAQGNLARAEARRAQAQIHEIEYTYNELLPAQKKQADMATKKIYAEFFKTQHESGVLANEEQYTYLRNQSYGAVDPKVRGYLNVVIDVLGSVGNLITAGGIGFGGVTQGIKNIKSISTSNANRNRPYQE